MDGNKKEEDKNVLDVLIVVSFMAVEAVLKCTTSTTDEAIKDVIEIIERKCKEKFKK